MRTLPIFLFFLLLLHSSGSALANGNEIVDSLGPSIEAGCIAALNRKTLTDYSQLVGMASENISSEVRAQLEEAIRPFHAICHCMAGKASAKLDSESENKVEITLDISGILSAAECAPTPNDSRVVQQNLGRLVEALPVPVRFLKTNRASFTLEVTVTNASPSVFASYKRPPESLTRLVFLAPGTGLACTPQDLFVENSPLEIRNAKEVLVSAGSFYGKEGSRNLQKIVEQNGDARIINSGSCYTNFEPNVQGWRYAINTLNGIPIEKTAAKRIWLVVFASKDHADPWAFDFKPAIAELYEVEFVD